MAAPLSGRGDPGLEAALARLVEALVRGPLAESRGFERLAERRALMHLLDACEALASCSEDSGTRSLQLALHWIEHATRSARSPSVSRVLRDCRARLLVLLRRVGRAGAAPAR